MSHLANGAGTFEQRLRGNLIDTRPHLKEALRFEEDGAPSHGEGQDLEADDSPRYCGSRDAGGSRFVGCLAVLGLSLSTVGCASSAFSDIGGRPLIYKQGPGNVPAQSDNAAGARPEAPAAKRPEAPAAKSAEPDAGQQVMAAGQPASAAAAPASAPPQSGVALPPALAKYTQASRYGDLLFLSGQIGVDPMAGSFAADATIEQQTRQVLENIRTILEAHRLTMANVISVTVYLVNINSLAAVDSVYPSYFKGALPARSVVEVARLPRSAQLEISVVAGR